jgi:hypothetical protein
MLRNLYDMIQKAFGNITMGHMQVNEYLGGSKRDGCQPRAINVQGDPPPAGTN